MLDVPRQVETYNGKMRIDQHPKPLGRREPDNREHEAKYPWSAVGPATTISVNKVLTLPWWHKSHDQGSEGACVGFGTSMMMAILNTEQRRVAKRRPYTVRYDPWWLWDEAKKIDYWADTNPGDSSGTSVKAACDVAHDVGLVRYNVARTLLPRLGFLGTADPSEGIAAFRWARTVDEMRACLALGVPISIGVDWYENFDSPARHPRTHEYWIGTDNDAKLTADLGASRGGHCVCIYGASDRRQAFRVKNSWGSAYPLVWLPYEVMEKLLADGGEACIVTDR